MTRVFAIPSSGKNRRGFAIVESIFCVMDPPRSMALALPRMNGRASFTLTLIVRADAARTMKPRQRLSDLIWAKPFQM